MLVLLSGSACSGKTTALGALRSAEQLRGRVAVHDADEVGVPSGAGTAWRQEALEGWVRRALDLQRGGLHLVLASQSPWGELLACPSAPALDGAAALLLDVDDDERLSRLVERDGERWDHQARGAFLGWARWHREHAADPSARQHVLVDGGWAAMRWDRWTSWRRGDPRWSVPVVDTTRTSVAGSGRRVVEAVAALLPGSG